MDAWGTSFGVAFGASFGVDPASAPLPPVNTGKTTPTHARSVQPNDAADLIALTKGVYVLVGGDLAVTMAEGETVTFSAVPSKTYLPISVRRIWQTGTTATFITALWE